MRKAKIDCIAFQCNTGKVKIYRNVNGEFTRREYTPAPATVARLWRAD